MSKSDYKQTLPLKTVAETQLQDGFSYTWDFLEKI